MKQPRDENGHYVAFGTLFERERLEHSKDHDRERLVAEETAKRLERTAEETARRTDHAVSVALAAVAETARIHAEAHRQQHEAHERIHNVEKQQVDRATAAMDRRLEGMNEFRATLKDQAGTFVSRDSYEERHDSLMQRVDVIDKHLGDLVTRLLFDTALTRISSLERKIAYYSGAAAVIGAAVAYIIRVATTH